MCECAEYDDGSAYLCPVCADQYRQWRDEGSCCEGCGRRYKVDLLVPDDLWVLIRGETSRRPESGLLCGRCIMDKIEGRGQFDVFELRRME